MQDFQVDDCFRAGDRPAPDHTAAWPRSLAAKHATAGARPGAPVTPRRSSVRAIAASVLPGGRRSPPAPPGRDQPGDRVAGGGGRASGRTSARRSPAADVHSSAAGGSTSPAASIRPGGSPSADGSPSGGGAAKAWRGYFHRSRRPGPHRARRGGQAAPPAGELNRPGGPEAETGSGPQELRLGPASSGVMRPESAMPGLLPRPALVPRGGMPDQDDGRGGGAARTRTRSAPPCRAG